jgi:hypothetical protein
MLYGPNQHIHGRMDTSTDESKTENHQGVDVRKLT